MMCICSVEETVKMKDVLKKLGMERAFEQKTAQFDALSAVPKWVDTVTHKTFVEGSYFCLCYHSLIHCVVNETGTEAAAVTSMGMFGGAAPKPEPFFKMCCDHPFLFAIRHRRSQTMLFVGKIASI